MVLDDIFGAIGDAIGAVVEGVGDAVGDVAADVVSDNATKALGDSMMDAGASITDSTDGDISVAKNDDLNVIKNTQEVSINIDKNVVEPASLISDSAIDTAVVAIGIASTKPKEKQQSETEQKLDD